MAKTTRKTDPTIAEKKPATRRPKAAETLAGAEKLTTRRRATPAPEASSAKKPIERSYVPEPTHDEIALRAWSIYESRGGGHDQALDDWLEARMQLFVERGLKA